MCVCVWFFFSFLLSLLSLSTFAPYSFRDSSACGHVLAAHHTYRAIAWSTQLGSLPFPCPPLFLSLSLSCRLSRRPFAFTDFLPAVLPCACACVRVCARACVFSLLLLLFPFRRCGVGAPFSLSFFLFFFSFAESVPFHSPAGNDKRKVHRIGARTGASGDCLPPSASR